MVLVQMARSRTPLTGDSGMSTPYATVRSQLSSCSAHSSMSVQLNPLNGHTAEAQ